MFILEDLGQGIKKARAADRCLGITVAKGIKRGQINMISGSAGSGKTLAGGASIFTSDPRLSAISREGCKIEINYNNYTADKIPGFLDWCADNGAGDYSIDGPFVTFVSEIDADLFWMTFVNVSLSRFMHSKGNLDEVSAQVRDARQTAIQRGEAVIIEHDGKQSMFKINPVRSKPGG